MVGTLSQLVALCSAANGRLAGRFEIGRFFPEHADFKFCRAVEFVRPTRDWLGRRRDATIAGDPNRWLAELAPQGARRAYLQYDESGRTGVPDHMLAAFVDGGGTWSLLVRYDQRVDRWLANWEVVDAKAPDRRIWRVTYRLASARAVDPADRIAPTSDDELQSTAEQLAEALAAAERLACELKLDGYADTFRRAAAMLAQTAPGTFPEYVEFVCLDCYTELAKRLLAAAYTGWVFGGIGSWNDVWPDDDEKQQRHADVTARLYAAITGAIEQATNSFAA